MVGIVDASGHLVVSYTYDAWGDPLSVTGTLASTIGNLNPIRYRGYVYDSEMGLYYLQSRYYNPEIGRFINADAYTSTGQGFAGNNMFAYCNNMPIVAADPCGLCLHWIWVWKDCPKCEGASTGEKVFLALLDGIEQIQKISYNMEYTFSNMSEVLGTIGNGAKGVTQAVVNNLEVSVGVGYGLLGHLEICEGVSVGFGAALDMVNLSLVDGKVRLQQRSSMGAELSVAFIDILSFDTQYYEFGNLNNPDTTTKRDAYTIRQFEGYFFGGVSASIGFDFASFCYDIDGYFSK